MALTTVVIDLKVGPFVPSEPTYVRWTPYERFVTGSTVVLDVGQPIRLIGGEGIVSVPPGLWIVDELTLNYVRTRAVRVPESAVPIQYVDLDEIADPAEYGVGPTWAARAELAGKAAEYAARLAQAAATSITKNVPGGVAVLDNDGYPVTTRGDRMLTAPDATQLFAPLQGSSEYVNREQVSRQTAADVQSAIAADPTVREAAAEAVRAELVEASVAPAEVLEDDEFVVRFSDSDEPILRVNEALGIHGTPVAGAMPEQLPAGSGWSFAIATRGPDGKRRVILGVREDGSHYPSVDQLRLESKAAVCRVGDSLTMDSAATEALLEARLGRDVVTVGLGGRTSAQIAARYGGRPALATVSGGTVPATGGVQVSLDRLIVLNGMQVSGVIAGVAGTLAITSQDGLSATFTRSVPGLPVHLARRADGVAIPVPFQTGESYRALWPILGMGRNDFYSSASWDTIVESIASCLGYATSDARAHALVLDIPPWAHEVYGTSVRNNNLDPINARLRDEFPTEFFPVYAMLRSAEALQSVGISPTATDVQNINNGVTPLSFRTDDGHLNNKGYEAMYRFIEQLYISKGWK